MQYVLPQPQQVSSVLCTTGAVQHSSELDLMEPAGLLLLPDTAQFDLRQAQYSSESMSAGESLQVAGRLTH